MLDINKRLFYQLYSVVMKRHSLAAGILLLFFGGLALSIIANKKRGKLNVHLQASDDASSKTISATVPSDAPPLLVTRSSSSSSSSSLSSELLLLPSHHHHVVETRRSSSWPMPLMPWRSSWGFIQSPPPPSSSSQQLLLQGQQPSVPPVNSHHHVMLPVARTGSMEARKGSECTFLPSDTLTFEEQQRQQSSSLLLLHGRNAVSGGREGDDGSVLVGVGEQFTS